MPRNINSKGLRAGPPRRKAERDAARYEAGDEAYAPGSDDEELNEVQQRVGAAWNWPIFGAAQF